MDTERIQPETFDETPSEDGVNVSYRLQGGDSAPNECTPHPQPEQQPKHRDRLPLGWQIARLGDVCKSTKQRNPAKQPEQLFEYVDVSSVSNQTYKITETQELSGEFAPSRARKIIQTNDVIFATVRPTLKRVALVPAELNDQICSTGYCVLKADAEFLDPSYLYFYLLTETVHQRVEAIQSGATYPAINDSDLFNLTIPLPPIAEQKEIAHTLRTLQTAKAARQRELALAQEHKAALMQHLFTHGIGSLSSQETQFGSIPADWQILPLKKSAIVQTGIAKGRKLEGDDIVTFPYLRVANVKDGYLDLKEIKDIQLRKSEVDRYLLKYGDILMTEGGDADKLGRGFIWHEQVPNCVHQNHVFAVRVNREILLPAYFAYLIQSDYGKGYFFSVAHRTTNLASINSSKLKAFPVPVPRLHEQKLIVETLDKCDSKISALQREITLLDELFHALLEQLMTGELSTVSPKHPVASCLRQAPASIG
ncbi:MAG: restriction endonuclease subunit S [Leptolyngbyaceae cyanobacterium bins.349]|nr:restriction endonuclease subunit S [Leptolyngbyaceae cyanobacterium bins.349]